MTLQTMRLDLDNALIVEVSETQAALLATCAPQLRGIGAGDRESREVAPVEARETIMPNVYDDKQVAQRYDAARALPAATLDLWMHTLQQLIPQPIDRIVDVGCGTGRFTGALATTFGCVTLGIDPAGPMLQAARATHGPAMHWVQAAADALPVVSDAVDVVWLSQVMHHLPDWAAVCRELHRVLRSRGYVVVRNGTMAILNLDV